MSKAKPATYRLRSSFFLLGLDRFSRLLSLPLFKPLHECVRLSHEVVTRPVLQFVLKSRHPNVLRVRLRHSQKMFGHFHVTLSDVDVSIIVRSEPTAVETARLSRTFSRLRRALIFLGELEVYTDQEFETKTHLEQTYPELLELIRLTRKFSWIGRARALPYHDLKFERSLRRNEKLVSSHLASEPVKFLTGRLKTVLDELDVTPEHLLEAQSYFGEGLSRLPPDVLKLFFFIAPGTADRVLSPRLLLLKLVVCQAEIIQARGRSRILAMPEDRDEIANLLRWAQRLTEDVARMVDELEKDQRLTDFDVHGLRLRLLLEDQSDLQKEIFKTAATEFNYFKTKVDFSKAPHVLARIGSLRAPTRTRPMPLRAGIGIVGWQRGLRSVRCDRGSYLEFRPRPMTSEISFCAAHEDEGSVLTNAIESVLGELLEKAGYLRLHAAAYAGSEGPVILSAPSGGGKSTSIARHLRHSTSLVYSDEVTWLKSGVVYPFPTPIALRLDGSMNEFSGEWTGRKRVFVDSTKGLLFVPKLSVAEAAPLQRLIAIESGKFRVFIWTARVVCGQGLPQMWPYLIRSENSFWLVRLALRRLKFALQALTCHKVEFQDKTEFNRVENGDENHA